jgi:hypothetical protein
MTPAYWKPNAPFLRSSWFKSGNRSAKEGRPCPPKLKLFGGYKPYVIGQHLKAYEAKE